MQRHDDLIKAHACDRQRLSGKHATMQYYERELINILIWQIIHILNITFKEILYEALQHFKSFEVHKIIKNPFSFLKGECFIFVYKIYNDLNAYVKIDLS